MAEDDLTIRLLRDLRANFDLVHAKLAEHDKRFDTADARTARLEVEVRSIKTRVNKNTTLLDAFIELTASLKAGRTVTDVSIRHHESELEEIRERLARLEEKA